MAEQLTSEFRIPYGKNDSGVTLKKTPISRKEIIIRSTNDFMNIKQKDPLVSRPRRIKLLLQLPYLSAEQRNYFEKKLSKYYSACGCESGAAFGLISLTSFIIIVSVVPAIQWNWFLILYGMGIFALAIFTGKVTGLTIANMRKKKLIQKIIDLKDQQ